MFMAPAPRGAEVLSYRALRRAVGIIAVSLPFALAGTWWFVCDHIFATSISGYYYTGMRNLFVGSLCALAMFMFCCRGYDRKDEFAGKFSALCAIGVAFNPTKPDTGATLRQDHIAVVHAVFATLLFLTLAYFCLVLFRMSAHGHKVTSKKRQRNAVYMVCGIAILASLLLIVVFGKFIKMDYLFGTITPLIFFETTSLIAFGIAWLVKGEAIPIMNDREK